MSTKRIKISSDIINQGKVTLISPREISESNERIQKEMRKVVRDYRKKAVLSEQDAAKLILNT